MTPKQLRGFEALFELIGMLLIAPPVMIWALEQLGLPLGYSWRTWIAVSLIVSYFKPPTHIKTEPR